MSFFALPSLLTFVIFRIITIQLQRQIASMFCGTSDYHYVCFSLVCSCIYYPLGASIKSTFKVVGGKTTEAFCLTLPGAHLDLSVLLKEKKFRGKGNKEGALQAMRNLQENGLRQLKEKENNSDKNKTDKTNKSSVKVLYIRTTICGFQMGSKNM